MTLKTSENLKPVNSLSNPDVIVIGAGIAGSMITKYLRSKGKQVLLIDCKKQYSGSKCSSGMWRDGWVNDKIREKYNAGLEVLWEFAGIDVIECENLDEPPVSSKKIQSKEPRIDELMYVNWKTICDLESAEFEVVSICKNVVTCFSNVNGQFNEKRKTQFVATDKVFICAGAYTDDLLTKSGYTPIGIDRYFGTAIETTDIKNPRSKIKTWAPYKQFLSARISPTKLKFSDGSMVKNPAEKGDERCDRIHIRLIEHIHEVMGKKFLLDKTDTKELFGLRPYLPAKKDLDFVNKHDTNLYSFTGTAKNTTILCGYLALRAWEIISGEQWKKEDDKN